MKRRTSQWKTSLVLLLSLSTLAMGAEEPPTKIPHPEKGSFVVDIPNLIDPLNEKEINQRLAALQEENAVTMYVVILDSLAKVGYEGEPIDVVGKELIEKWKLGPKTLDGKPWDRGVLFILSRKDGGGENNKKGSIRIETAKGWGKNLDRPSLAVIQRDMVPYFQKSKFSLGVTKGIHSLDAAIRMQTPSRKTPPKVPTPKDTEFVIDMVNLLPLNIKLHLDRECRKVYQTRSVPIFIVTVPSFEKISRKELAFDAIAERFFTFWEIEPAQRRQAFRKRGVLLVFSRDDNLIGLQFADGWGNAKAKGILRQEIMSKHLVPAFQKGMVPQGLLGSIKTLNAAAQEANFPKLPKLPKLPAAPAKQPATQSQ